MLPNYGARNGIGRGPQGLDYGVRPMFLSLPFASSFEASRRTASRYEASAAAVSPFIRLMLPRKTYIGDEPGKSSSFNFRIANASSNLFARPRRNAAVLSELSPKSYASLP